MAVNGEAIREKYANGGEDARATMSRASGIEFHYTKKLLEEYIGPDSRVIELGCATGYYGLHFAGRCAQYVGVDITPENIAVFNEKIKAAGIKNIRAKVGDATGVSEPDGGFDAVLCLGPMYHLPPEEREKVFAECKRVAKDGAAIAFAYISPMGAYLKAALTWPDVYPNARADERVLDKGIDDLHPDIFFYAAPEQMVLRAAAHGLEILKNAGTDFTFSDALINNMSRERFASWMRLADRMAAHGSCAGLANHSLLICKK